MASSKMNEETAESFGECLGDILSHGFLTVGLSLGSKLGLFDLMAGIDQPQTSQQIAEAAGFKERYVREWLNFMVVGGIIDKNADGSYFLPHHRRQFLSGHHKGNKVILSWSIPIVSQKEKNLMEVFKLDGPRVIDGECPGIHEWRHRMTGDSLAARITFLLKATGVPQQLEEGIEMMEAGCGTGQIILELARRYPKSTFLGLDIADDALNIARKTAEDEGLHNIKFENQDVCNLPSDWKGKFDWIYGQNIVHDVPFPRELLKGIYLLLKPGGKFSVIEVNLHTDSRLNKTNPLATLFSLMGLYTCLASSYGPEGGEGLSSTWGQEKALEYLKNVGFSSVKLIDEHERYFHCLCIK